jgi:hypothetical protein
MTKSILFGTALALTATAASAAEAAEDTRSANYMMPGCRGFVEKSSREDAFKQGECTGIVWTVASKGLDTYVALLSALPADSDMAAFSKLAPFLVPLLRQRCLAIPDEVTLGQIVRVVVAYIDARPAEMHADFVQLALEALRTAWPCR